MREPWPHENRRAATQNIPEQLHKNNCWDKCMSVNNTAEATGNAYGLGSPWCAETQCSDLSSYAH